MEENPGEARQICWVTIYTDKKAVEYLVKMCKNYIPSDLIEDANKELGYPDSRTIEIQALSHREQFLSDFTNSRYISTGTFVRYEVDE